MNSKQLDKDSPVSAFAVNRCYAAAQEGTFFEGSGYAALGMYNQQSRKKSLGRTCTPKMIWVQELYDRTGPTAQAAARPCFVKCSSVFWFLSFWRKSLLTSYAIQVASSHQGWCHSRQSATCGAGFICTFPKFT